MASVIDSLLTDLGISGSGYLSVKELLCLCILAFGLAFISEFIAIITDFARK